MPVLLSVSQVRKEIHRLAGYSNSSEDKAPSTRLLGRIFHESFARLLGSDDRFNWKPALIEATPDEQEWQQRLMHHLYERLIGPAIQREQVHLRNTTHSVIAFWTAAQELCEWLASLLWESRKPGTDIDLVFSPEQEVSISFFETGWTDSVVLSGIADLVLKIPESTGPNQPRATQNSNLGTQSRPHWCVVEFKLGLACPEADLAQVCLYHRMLSEQAGALSGVMAYIRFSPDKTERIFMPDEIRDAQKHLKNLIARLAGVLPGGSVSRAPPPRDMPVPQNSPSVLPQAEQLVSIFSEYGKEISLDGSPVTGPTFIRFFIRLGKGVKLTTVQGIGKEIQHRMELAAPPYIHISEGRVVVDIQRPDRQMIRFSDIRNQLPKPDASFGCSQIILGVDLSNTLRMADLAEPENAHILIGGTTGSGKSEWMRTAIAGLLLTNTPDTLRLVLIDPKRNAFNDLKGSAFLLNPSALVYPDEQPAERVLEELADEMERRYKRLQEAGADTVDRLGYLARVSLPRILCICDEYFDLINRDRESRKKIEAQIFRLGAKARSAGIHLMIATQHPNRQTIKGTLDVNLPARVGLKVSKGIDAAVLLNRKGAENLLGNGDLLFKNIGEPVRLQSPLLGIEERRLIFAPK
ncbi:MAG: FtsK/SpoIIIE domain-containing protein [Pseudomonadota bacterium]